MVYDVSNNWCSFEHEEQVVTRAFWVAGSATRGKCHLVKEVEALTVVRNEEFGLQYLVRSDQSYFLNCGEHSDIAWDGLQSRLRVEVVPMPDGFSVPTDSLKKELDIQLHIVGSVKGDDGVQVSDILEGSSGRTVASGEQSIYVSVKIPADFAHPKFRLLFKAFASEGYGDEVLVDQREVLVQVANFEVASSSFYMDLWQHPCNWARAYHVPYYGDAHFEIIDHYLEGMSRLGQKVCDLIISDYPWAGQRCYLVPDNHNNLFERNIVKVYKDERGEIRCDFRAFDAYIAIAQKYGMAEEINLFGVLCNWDAYSFGNPLEDFYDPIRISYLDRRDGLYKFFKSVSEVEQYLRLVFRHIDELGLWDRTLIMSDEPSNSEYFEQSLQLFDRAAEGKRVSLKCAIHDQLFFEGHADRIKSLSLNTCELVQNIAGLEELHKKVRDNGGTLTWYSCCFPTKLNIFLKSPLIESRLVGWFTYYMNLDGFLRWAYGVWPGDVFHDARYKPEKWAAGDMFLVYPGKHLKPLESLRLKNILYGLQDYLLFKSVEEVLGRDVIVAEMEALFGKKDEMKYVEPREIEIEHCIEEDRYLLLRENLLQKAIQCRNAARRKSDGIVEMEFQ